MEPEYSSTRDISKDWEKIRLRFLLSENLTNGLFKKAEFWGKGRPVVNVSDVYGHDDTINLSSLDKVSCDDAEYQRYSAIDGDFFFVRSSLALDGIGKTAMISEPSEEAVFECHLVRGRPDREMVNPRFLNYCLNSASSKAYFKSVANLVTMATIDQMKLKNLQLLLPCLDEQQKIATFLDHKTQQIDQLIEKKKALIEKLEEQRIAVITQAVTKGLDKDVKLVPSGVDWLGDVPDEWAVIRLRFLIESLEQGWSPQCDNYTADEDQWGVLKVGCVNGDRLDEKDNKALPPSLEPKTEYEILPGDILISRANTRELLGSTALAPDSVRQKLLLCDKLYRLIPSSDVDRVYLTYFLRTPISRYQYEREATGASGSMQNIGQATIKNLPIVVPSLEQQQKIVEFINHKTEHLDGMVAKIESAKSKLEEYRSSLITAAVTGKIDVRNWQEQKEAA